MYRSISKYPIAVMGMTLLGLTVASAQDPIGFPNPRGGSRGTAGGGGRNVSTPFTITFTSGNSMPVQLNWSPGLSISFPPAGSHPGTSITFPQSNSGAFQLNVSPGTVIAFPSGSGGYNYSSSTPITFPASSNSAPFQLNAFPGRTFSIQTGGPGVAQINLFPGTQITFPPDNGRRCPMVQFPQGNSTAFQLNPIPGTTITFPQGGCIDLSPRFALWGLPVKRQGARNTCSVCVMTAALEYAAAMKLNSGTPLSVEFLNWACNRVVNNQTQDRGQFFSDLWRAYENDGICQEGDMPYQSSFMPGNRPSQIATIRAVGYRGMGLTVHWIKPNNGRFGIDDTHMAAIKDALRQGRPVCAGAGHSTLIVGFNDDADGSGNGRFTVRDSGTGSTHTLEYADARINLADLLWIDAPIEYKWSRENGAVTIPAARRVVKPIHPVTMDPLPRR